MNIEHKKFSVVILTFNRERYLRKQLDALIDINNCEIIIVDNCSEKNYASLIKEEYPAITLIALDKNYGAVGRNFGIIQAKGDYIITLDDDIYGLSEKDLREVERVFKTDTVIQALCFKVVDEKNGSICNWCHPRDPAIYGNTTFETYNISEGAVAFRRDLFKAIDVYPWDFFISHEGPDLGYRIINANYKTIYTPTIYVTHAYAPEGRKSWRRYYYDTRNTIWLAYRNYPMIMLIRKLPLQIIAMFVYSIRDGFLLYFFKGIRDGLTGVKNQKSLRNPLSKAAYARLKLINSQKPSLLFYLKKRLFKKGVKV